MANKKYYVVIKFGPFDTEEEAKHYCITDAEELSYALDEYTSGEPAPDIDDANIIEV